MSRLITLTSSTKSIIASAAFIVAMTLGGCSADAIMGPEQSEGPTMNTSSQPHDSHPDNDDCSVGGC